MTNLCYNNSNVLLETFAAAAVSAGLEKLSDAVSVINHALYDLKYEDTSGFFTALCGEEELTPFNAHMLRASRGVIYTSGSYGVYTTYQVIAMARLGRKGIMAKYGEHSDDSGDIAKAKKELVEKGLATRDTKTGEFSLSDRGETAHRVMTSIYRRDEITLSKLSDLKDTSVEVRTREEYDLAKATYLSAGAEVWPFHRGYKERDTEEHGHHIYTWEECGFLKLAGLFEDSTGTFQTVTDLVIAYNALKEGKIYICFKV
jgi:hypothetical protein